MKNSTKTNTIISLSILSILLSAILINPIWVLFVVSGFLLGISIHLIIENSRIRHYIISGIKRILLFLFVLFLGILVILTAFTSGWLKLNIDTSEMPVPIIQKVRYSSNISYRPENWIIEHKVIFEESLIDSILKDQSLYKVSLKGETDSIYLKSLKKEPDIKIHQTKKLISISKLMSINGWKLSGIVNGKLQHIKIDRTPISLRIIPAYSYNNISIPVIKYENLILIPDENSEVILDVPKQIVIDTFPKYYSRIDLFEDNRERLVIPLIFKTEKEHTLKIKLLNLLFRNRLGRNIVNASFYAPVKWLFLALIAIFADQIRKRILVPIA